MRAAQSAHLAHLAHPAKTLMRVNLDAPFRSDGQKLTATHIKTFGRNETLTHTLTSLLSLAAPPLMRPGSSAQAGAQAPRPSVLSWRRSGARVLARGQRAGASRVGAQVGRPE
jgi:hypothetical protein